MSCCATHVKRIDPVTGSAIVYDLATGAVVSDPLVIAALECCPDRSSDKEKVCVQTVGNTDPAAVEAGWLVTVKEIDAAGTLTILSTVLYDEGMVTSYGAPGDTHEVVACPDDTPLDQFLCLP